MGYQCLGCFFDKMMPVGPKGEPGEDLELKVGHNLFILDHDTDTGCAVIHLKSDPAEVGLPLKA